VYVRRSTVGKTGPLVLGFLVCFYIWLHLSLAAKIAGSSWLAVGAVYGWRRGVFRKRHPEKVELADQQ